MMDSIDQILITSNDRLINLCSSGLNDLIYLLPKIDIKKISTNSI